MHEAPEGGILMDPEKVLLNRPEDEVPTMTHTSTIIVTITTLDIMASVDVSLTPEVSIQFSPSFAHPRSALHPGDALKPILMKRKMTIRPYGGFPGKDLKIQSMGQDIMSIMIWIWANFKFIIIKHYHSSHFNHFIF